MSTCVMLMWGNVRLKARVDLNHPMHVFISFYFILFTLHRKIRDLIFDFLNF